MVMNGEDVTKVVTSRVTNMEDMFEETLFFNQDIGSWDTSNVTDMTGMFFEAKSFNQDIGNWDVRNVINMGSMFSGASSFNQNIGSWDVSMVRNMGRMFFEASEFNQDIGNWDVGNVINMGKMFQKATVFNQKVNNWNLKNVTNMSEIFSDASSFNQNIGSWNVSNVVKMVSMFKNAESFNQNIGSWNVSNVTDMGSMFSNASSFNQDISSWNVSKVTDMSQMFKNAESFNQDLSKWNCPILKTIDSFSEGASSWDSPLSNPFAKMGKIYLDKNGITIKVSKEAIIGEEYEFNGQKYKVVDEEMLREMVRNEGNEGDFTKVVTSRVTNMSEMFFGASTFNQNIGTWDLSNVTDMSAMFRMALSFNQDISSWNVSKVTDMDQMFKYASSFKQDLSSWDVSNVRNMMEEIYDEINLFKKTKKESKSNNKPFHLKTGIQKMLIDWYRADGIRYGEIREMLIDAKITQLNGIIEIVFDNGNIDKGRIENDAILDLNSEDPEEKINLDDSKDQSEELNFVWEESPNKTEEIIYDLIYELPTDVATITINFIGSADDFEEFLDCDFYDLEGNNLSVDEDDELIIDMAEQYMFDIMNNAENPPDFNGQGSGGSFTFDLKNRKVTLEVEIHSDDPDYTGDQPPETFS